jgi:uncharacterized protein YjbI with pentapeptide repeats
VSDRDVILAEKLGVMGSSFEGMDLSGVDLSGKDLSTCNFTRVNFRGAKLTGADLTKAVLDEADLTEADLFGAILVKASLRGVKVKGTNFTRANLSEAVFEPALAEAGLAKGVKSVPTDQGYLVSVAGGDVYFDGRKVNRHDLQWVGQGAPMDWLRDVKEHLPLMSTGVGQFVDFARACRTSQSRTVPPHNKVARGLSFNGLDLSGGRFEGVDFSGSTFEDTIFDGTTFTNCNFTGCRFEETSHNGKDKRHSAIFRNCDLSQVEMDGWTWNFCFVGCDKFDGAKLSELNLSFEECQLSGAAIVSLSGMVRRFEKCSFKGATLEGGLDHKDSKMVSCSLAGVEIPDGLIVRQLRIEDPKDFTLIQGPSFRLLVINGPEGRQVWQGDPEHLFVDFVELSDPSEIAACLEGALDMVRP